MRKGDFIRKSLGILVITEPIVDTDEPGLVKKSRCLPTSQGLLWSSWGYFNEQQPGLVNEEPRLFEEAQVPPNARAGA